MKSITFTLLVLAFSGISINAKAQFVKTNNGRFTIDDKPYSYIGANFWYGAILASKGIGGDRQRLLKELDLMKQEGITNLRILVGGDGGDTVATKVQPALQIKPGIYNDTIFDGLDYLLYEMGKRNMYAVLFLNNSWDWSGGFSQYLEWTGDYGNHLVTSVIGWDDYCKYVSNFLRSEKAKQLFLNHVGNVLIRNNRYTGKSYKNDPAIMSWQICNEPRPFSKENKRLLAEWLENVGSFIKRTDQNHLVSTGSEGEMGSDNDIYLWEEICASRNIDYATIHIWPFNWGWVDKKDLPGSMNTVTSKFFDYLHEHLAVANKLNKPLVMEEFGLPRDNFSFSPDTSTKSRDYLYKNVFDTLLQAVKLKNGFAGCNFWAWGGTGRATKGHIFWQKGDAYLGDPAQEEQGLNSVFDTDSTMYLIQEYNEKIQQVLK